jgi:hypothetical protein
MTVCRTSFTAAHESENGGTKRRITAIGALMTRLTAGRVECREQSVPRRHDLFSAQRLQLSTDGGVVVIHHLCPTRIAQPRGFFGGPDDIDKQVALSRCRYLPFLTALNNAVEFFAC